MHWYEKLQFIHNVNGDRSKTAVILPTIVYCLNVNVMLSSTTFLPIFCNTSPLALCINSSFLFLGLEFHYQMWVCCHSTVPENFEGGCWNLSDLTTSQVILLYCHFACTEMVWCLIDWDTFAVDLYHFCHYHGQYSHFWSHICYHHRSRQHSFHVRRLKLWWFAGNFRP